MAASTQIANGLHADGLRKRAGQRKGERIISPEELAFHGTQESLWIAIAGKVYDVTRWQDKHPGGVLPLLTVAGDDGTDVFNAMHPPQIYKQLAKFYIGELEETTPDLLSADSPSPPVTPTTPQTPTTPNRSSANITAEERALIRDYRSLNQEIKEQGLADPQLGYYMKLAGALAAVMAGIVWGVVCTESTVVHMVCAVALGMWWHQVAFLGHDSGHNSLTKNMRYDSALGYVTGNLLNGISMGWWKRSHNVHHIVCNSVNYDPDIQHIPVFAISQAYFKPQFSLYHFREITFDAAARFLVSYQHWTFFPLMFGIARLNLYLQGLLLVFSTQKLKNRPLEIALLAVYWAWVSALILQLPSLTEMVAFFFISHAMTGFLHLQITVSHYASPTYEGRNAGALWAQTQLEGTINVGVPSYLDWFFGGLHYQIEHHLFPNLPRCNLRKISPAVQAFCKKHGVPYISMSFWDALMLTVGTLRENAMVAREMAYNKSLTGRFELNGTKAFYTSLLWDGLNARG